MSDRPDPDENPLQRAARMRYGAGEFLDLANLDAPDLVRFATRASVRKFAQRPIAPALIEALLLCAQSAPSKSDLQQYSIIRIEAASRRRELARIAGGEPWIADAPLILVFLGDLRRMREVCRLHDLGYDNDNLDSFMNASVDAGIALTGFMLAAESQGLGCCPLSIIRNDIEATARFLRLPKHVFPVAALGVGYPQEDQAVSPRLPQSVVVHHETYNDQDESGRLAEYDRIRRVRQPVPAAKQRHPKIYGIDPKLSWSGNAARQMSIPERAGFRAWLRGRGILAD